MKLLSKIFGAILLLSITMSSYAIEKKTPSGVIVKDELGKSQGGFVGEKITWNVPPVSQAITTSETDWANSNIILPEGVWLVTANILVSASTATTAGFYAASRVKLLLIFITIMLTLAL